MCRNIPKHHSLTENRFTYKQCLQQRYVLAFWSTFGIDTEKYFFRFWDWVGGRYSVCSAVGGIPISLLYGYDLFEKFLQVSDYSEMDACMDTIS